MSDQPIDWTPADEIAKLRDKAEAFDLLTRALTNRWADGKWSWWCRTPMGGESRETRQEAIQDLVEWAKRPTNQRDSHVRVVALQMQSAALPNP